MKKCDIIRERVERLEVTYAKLILEMDALVTETHQKTYFISSTHWNCKIALTWAKCGLFKDFACPWCIGTTRGGHGPYWVKIVYSTDEKNRVASQSKKDWSKTTRLKSITHQSLKDAFSYEDKDGVFHKCTHSRGYSVLHPLDVRKKEIAEKLKIVKDALNNVESKMRYAEMRLKSLGA